MVDLRRVIADRLAGPRARRIVRGSGLFDRAWYEERSGRSFASLDEAIGDYVDRGASELISPHPLFDAAWYAGRVKAAARSNLGPLAHYLGRGAARGDTTHPVIDAEHYLATFPDAIRHPAGIVGHYLAVGWREDGELNDWFDADAYRAAQPDVDPDEPAIVDFVRRAQRRLDEVPDHRDFPRSYARFDEAGSRRFVDDVLARYRDQRGDAAGPLVSVIVPTRDRADVLPTAIGSVLGQTYGHWELLIVDDGSTDDTAEVVGAFADPRIRLLPQPPTGVCRARNHGLEEARGALVAYLDSDNAWEPGYLEVMVAALETGPLDAAYAALQMEQEGETRYRGVPFDLGALLEANYVDCNTLVHRRVLADEIGGWDEQLRRTNDWDFVIRLARVTELGYVPFVGVRYDHDAERGDRITVREPIGYRMKVRAKHLLDWEAAARAPTEPDLVSIVIVTAGNPALVRRCVDAVVTHTSEPHEIVVVDLGLPLDRAFELLALEATAPTVRVVRSATDLYDAIGADLGIIAARGEVVVSLNPAIQVRPGWLGPLLAPLRAGEASATQPAIITPTGVVRSAGYLVPAHQIPFAAFEGFAEQAPEVADPADRQAVDGMCLAALRRDLVAVEGVDAMYRVALTDVDLCLRLREHTGRSARYVAEATVVHGPGRHRSGSDHGAADQRVFEERWMGRLPADEDVTLGGFGLRRLFYEYSRGKDTFGQPIHAPVVTWVADRPRRRRWAIKVGPRSVELRNAWGDWHFGMAIKEQLEALDQDVSLDLRTAWYRPTAHLDDVVLNLRGIQRYVPNPQHVNLMWLISHPDLVVDTEVARYDHVFAASLPFARRLDARGAVSVEPMLQCTDPSRFARGDRDPDGASVLFVGNSRDVLRPIVRDALAAGLPLDVYGGGWSHLIPKRHVRGTYLPNEELAVAYRSAGVVLNDHWEDMRREGFISNRLFDLAACGARVISDHVDGIHDIFGDLVRIYRDPDDLARLVAETAARDADEEPARQELSERIAREHSFAARAARLVEVAETALADGRRATA